MEQSFLSQYFLPLALFIVMLGLGLGLGVSDFRRIRENPLSVALGIGAQMLMLPFLGWIILSVLKLPNDLALGLFILCLCPGGVTSNLYCFLSRGNVALSITLTAIVSLISPFTIPLLTRMAMGYLDSEVQDFSLPIGRTIGTLIAMTLLPVGIGMLIRSKRPHFAAKSERWTGIFSMVFLAAIVAGIAVQNGSEIPGFMAEVGPAVLILNISALVLGYGLARIARRSRPDAISIGIEVGIQNGTTALFITSTLMSSPAISVAPATYSLIMFFTGALYAVFWRRARESGLAPA